MSATPIPARAPERWLVLLHEMADRADAAALSFFRSNRLRVDDKSDGSPVSEADRAIETMARELVATRAPELGVLGEEEGESTSRNGARLIIDPIDGTRNFVRGIPIFATLLAIEDAGRIVVGVVSAPALHQRWHAARGIGAFVGSRRLHVSTIQELSRAHVFHADLSGRTEGVVPPRVPDLFRSVERTRGFGDFYQHMLVAEGAGEVALDFKMQPWDIAALKIIVEEAGGRATSTAGEDTIYGGSLMSTNGIVHAAVATFLRAP